MERGNSMTNMPPSEPGGADKRTMLRDHYLFENLPPQHIDRLSACIFTKRTIGLLAELPAILMVHAACP
jgi:hypothetical protein